MAVTAALLDKRWATEPKYDPFQNRHNEVYKSELDPVRYLPPGTVAYYLVEPDKSLDQYVSWLADWLKRKKIVLNRLIVSAHGNSGRLFIGKPLRRDVPGQEAGLVLENAGMFRELEGLFDMGPGARRVVEIYGCGVASSTQVGLRELDKEYDRWPGDIRDAVRRDQVPTKAGDSLRFTLRGTPHVIVWGAGSFTLLTQGVASADLAGPGYRLLKAIANCTRAYVTAPVHQESNFPPYFSYKLQYLWVYPDTRAQEEKYGLNPHKDGTTDAVLVMP